MNLDSSAPDEPADPSIDETGSDETGPDGPRAGEPTRSRRRGSGGAAVLSAAMLALGDVLEPEKTTVEIVQSEDDPIDDLPFKLDFGNLPPLE